MSKADEGQIGSHDWVASRKAGRHDLGDGLKLLVQPGGSRSFITKFKLPNGRWIDRGLGGFPEVDAFEARDRVAETQRWAWLEYLADHGETPAAQAEAKAEIAEIEAATAAIREWSRPNAGTFKAIAAMKLGDLKPTWRNPEAKARKWWSSLERHAFPLIGGLQCNEITRADVIAVLRPIWHEKPVAAKEVRQRVRQVMALAMAHDESILSNPAGEALDGVLPRQRHRTAHRAALPPDEVAGALKVVDDFSTSSAALCLRFLVLTAVRSIEAREAVWSEIDGDTWTIPAERMKMGEPHRVPLSRQALDVLDDARELPDAGGEFVFPGRIEGRPIAQETPAKALRDNGVKGTVAGMRSVFRDWAQQQGAPFEVAERALAHKIGTTVTQAYLRCDLLDERRDLMQAWGNFIG